MPFHEADPWRLQYFANVTTAANVTTEDADAWLWNPRERWIYDKLRVALSQGLDAGPHGTRPSHFPVFSKPITNLTGMGAGSRVLHSQAEYERHATPGHFWMTMLAGRHVSSDLAVVDGVPQWWRHVTGKPAGDGTFDYWTVHAEPDAEIESRCGAWVKQYLAGYTGMLNLETIGGAIIEGHLRFADQWPDLYGAGWVDAIVRLYETGVWEFADAGRRGGYSVCCLDGTACAIATRRRRCSNRSSACRASQACRSPFMKTCRLKGTRCRPAASGLPSSIASIWRQRWPRGSGCANVSSARRFRT